MIIPSDPGHWIATYIDFAFVEKSPSGKTDIWRVADKSGFQLGLIAWFSRWRKYSFYPSGHTVYEQTCLREIAEFIDERMAERRKAK